MLVRLQDGRLKDVAVSEVTKENYIVPQNEQGLYHCKMELVKFNENTGKRINKPTIQKVGKRAFESIMRKQWTEYGYTIEILHDPTEWLARNSATRNVSQQALIDSAVKNALAQQKAAFDKQLEEAVAKAMAKQSKGKK
jgi:hypothetical protein